MLGFNKLSFIMPSQAHNTAVSKCQVSLCWSHYAEYRIAKINNLGIGKLTQVKTCWVSTSLVSSCRVKHIMLQRQNAKCHYAEYHDSKINILGIMGLIQVKICWVSTSLVSSCRVKHIMLQRQNAKCHYAEHHGSKINILTNFVANL